TLGRRVVARFESAEVGGAGARLAAEVRRHEGEDRFRAGLERLRGPGRHEVPPEDVRVGSDVEPAAHLLQDEPLVDVAGTRPALGLSAAPVVVLPFDRRLAQGPLPVRRAGREAQEDVVDDPRLRELLVRHLDLRLVVDERIVRDEDVLPVRRLVLAPEGQAGDGARDQVVVNPYVLRDGRGREAAVELVGLVVQRDARARPRLAAVTVVERVRGAEDDIVAHVGVLRGIDVDADVPDRIQRVVLDDDVSGPVERVDAFAPSLAHEAAGDSDVARAAYGDAVRERRLTVELAALPEALDVAILDLDLVRLVGLDAEIIGAVRMDIVDAAVRRLEEAYAESARIPEHEIP